MYQQPHKMSQVPQLPHKKSLFKEKVLVCKEKFQDIRTDAVINFCTPNVLTGPPLFDQLHEMAGPKLMESCHQFAGLAPTSCRVTSSFDADNFKSIAHTVVPAKLDLTKEVDLHAIYLCVRNSLDRASEDGARTIAFPPYFPSVDLAVGCEIILRIFSDWIHRSIYSDQNTILNALPKVKKTFLCSKSTDLPGRREVKDGYLLPQDAYKKAVSRVLEESAREHEVSGAVEKFPEWHRLRQQYCRIRKTALTKQYRDEGYDYSQKYPMRKYKPAGRYSPSQYGHGGSYADEDVSSYSVMKDVGPVKGEDMEEEDGPIVVDDDIGATKSQHTQRQYIPAQEAATMIVEKTGRIPRKE
ncbi:macro domain-containing protein [Ditylenchus destructor]|nr:macro domain-containing protein [Ditylenchus destructor]